MNPAGVVVLAFVLTAGSSLAAERTATVAAPAVDITEVRPNLFMLSLGSTNIAVHVGDDGVIVVDSGTKAGAPEVSAAIKRIAPGKSVRYLINTSADVDRVGGNELLAREGKSMISFAGTTVGNTLLDGFNNSGAAAIVATENAFIRMSGRQKSEGYATLALPTEAFPETRRTLFLNGEGIEIVALKAAHTDADCVVVFRRSDVVVTGALFTPDRFPVINREEGGSIQGLLDALNRLIGMTVTGVPLPSREGGTRVVTGSGRLTEQAELVEYRDMVTIIRDRIRHAVEAGKSLQEVLGEDPTQGYNRLYGTIGGDASAAKFVAAIYADLEQAQSGRHGQ